MKSELFVRGFPFHEAKKEINFLSFVINPKRFFSMSRAIFIEKQKTAFYTKVWKGVLMERERERQIFRIVEHNGTDKGSWRRIRKIIENAFLLLLHLLSTFTLSTTTTIQNVLCTFTIPLLSLSSEYSCALGHWTL